MFGRIDWVGWRLARGEDGRGWPSRVLQGDPPFLVHNECDSSPFDHQSILLKDYFMGTAKIILNRNFYIFYFFIHIFIFLHNGCLNSDQTVVCVCVCGGVDMLCFPTTVPGHPHPHPHPLFSGWKTPGCL